MEKFPLTNVVLYAKGWYEKTDDIWGDLKKVLELDNYTPFTKNDVYNILTQSFGKFECRQSELREVMFGIHPSECWKYGYDFEEYDMPTAFIYYVLSTLRCIDNTKWNPQTPKYTKLKRPKGIPIRRVYEMFIESK
jgi:hypothetical protein